MKFLLFKNHVQLILNLTLNPFATSSSRAISSFPANLSGHTPFKYLFETTEHEYKSFFSDFLLTLQCAVRHQVQPHLSACKGRQESREHEAHRPNGKRTLPCFQKNLLKPHAMIFFPKHTCARRAKASATNGIRILVVKNPGPS